MYAHQMPSITHLKNRIRVPELKNESFDPDQASVGMHASSE